jgi:GNAT superfamily N-acetyltransferase
VLIREARVEDLGGILGLYRHLQPDEDFKNTEKYRRKGYGKELLQNAIDRARRHNCYKIMLLSNADRKEAHEFYKSLGFDAKSKTGFLLHLP